MGIFNDFAQQQKNAHKRFLQKMPKIWSKRYMFVFFGNQISLIKLLFFTTLLFIVG